MNDPTNPERVVRPVSERFDPQFPTVNQQPAPQTYAGDDLCGNCPGWKRQHPQAPFGQCLPAIRWLGAPMYTPDLAGCTLPIEVKAKGVGR